ncbi:hypothetical protein H4I96_07653 [Botrytis cinerea]
MLALIPMCTLSSITAPASIVADPPITTFLPIMTSDPIDANAPMRTFQPICTPIATVAKMTISVSPQIMT